MDEFDKFLRQDHRHGWFFHEPWKLKLTTLSLLAVIYYYYVERKLMMGRDLIIE